MQKRVLLVDDHPLMRIGLRAFFEAKSDMSVVGEATDGISAIEMAERLSPDIIIMDLSLHKLGGGQAIERIQAYNQSTKILVLTGHEDRAYVQLSLQAGASGFLLKRSAAEHLTRALGVIVNGGIFVDPAVAADAATFGWSGVKSTPARASLSDRESEVLQLSAQGRSMKETAALLNVGVRTVETYKSRAMDKLHLRNRADLVRYALQCGWLKDS